MNRKTLSWLGPLVLLGVVVAGVWFFVFRESPLQRVDRIMTEAREAMNLYEFKKAEQLVLDAIDVLPHSPVLQHDLAVIYLRQERPDDAKAAFTRAASLHGPEANEPRAIEFFQIANIDVKQGRYEEAERALEMAIAAHPTRRILHTRLIDLQLGFLEKPARADSSTRRFLRLCKPTTQNFFDVARVHYGRKNMLTAAALAKQAAAQADTLIDAHALTGRALWRAGRADSGLAYLAGPLERYPDAVDLWVVQGSLLIGAERYDDAMRSLERALELAPENYEAHRARMMGLFMAERYEESIAAAEVCSRLTDNEDEQRFLRMHVNRVRDVLSGKAPPPGQSSDSGSAP